MNEIAIFDGHNDAVQLMREYTSGGIDFLAANAGGHLDLPRARQGGMFGGLFAMWVAPDGPSTGNLTTAETSYSVRMAEALDPAYARQETLRELAALKSLVARSSGSIRIATTAGEIEQARHEGTFCMLLHLEGAEAIGSDLIELDDLYRGGLRSLGPVWSRPNVFGHGVPFAFPSSPDTGPGLTSAGFDLIQACNRLGILIDVSHLNERGFWDVANTTTAPLVATHSCAHALCPSARNLTDRQLDAIRESDGVVGLNFCVNDLRPDAHRNSDVSLNVLVEQITYLADRIGIERVALGSDFDGATIPSAIGDASGLQDLIAALRTHGFDEHSLRRIACENWLNTLRRTID